MGIFNILIAMQAESAPI